MADRSMNSSYFTLNSCPKVITYKDTTQEESENSNSDNCSEFDPNFEMGETRSDVLDERLKKIASDRAAQVMVGRSRARKVTAPSGGKVVGGISGTAVTNSDLITASAPKATPMKGRGSQTPLTYDVEKCARWKPPSDVGEKEKVELGKLPRLPTPRECPNFGLLGTGPKYARHVIAPYMSFTRDRTRLKAESTSSNFDAMLEATTEVMARLSFASQAVIEREATLERSIAERDHENMKLHTAIQKLEVEKLHLINAAVLQYDNGRDEGEMVGWEEALRYFVDGGHVTQAVADGLICPFPLSKDFGDGEDVIMETDGDRGPVGDVVTGDETM